jgi:two-component system sensor histidine kinase VicK
MIDNSGRTRDISTKVFDDLYRNIEHLPMATAILSNSGQTVEHVNKAFLALFRQNAMHISNSHNRFVCSYLNHPAVQQTISRAYQSGEAVKKERVQMSIAGATGNENKYLDFYATPILDYNNSPTSGILLTIIDITRTVEFQKQFGESERSYRNLMETMAVAVYTCDMEGRVNFHNDAAVTLWGRKPELGVELWCGSHKMYTLDGDWMPHDQCPAAISLKERRAVKAEALVQRPDGKMRHVLVFPRPEHDIHGNIIGLINAVVDITDRKALERQKDDFMSIVAHELKTPITSIKGYAQVLAMQLSDLHNEEVNQVQGRMEVQINNLINLIEKMLNAAKIESGEQQFKKEKFDLTLLIREVVQDVQLSAKAHRLIFTPVSPVFAVGDKAYTAQVLINLLSNAIKYSPKADQVIINIKHENAHSICSIQDFGFGISPDQKSTIFEKYYRVKTENVNRFPGVGLGLYLSAEIIRQMGGEIWVESEIDKGSTFSFSLPALSS